MGTRTTRASGQRVEFFTGLRGARILVAYLAVGLLASLYLIYVGYGTALFVSYAANLALAGLYVLIINVATAGSAPLSQPVQRPLLETVIVLAYAAFLVLRATAGLEVFGLDWEIPVYHQLDGLLVGTAASAISSVWPGGAPGYLYTMLSNLFWVLLVPLLVFLALGYQPSALALTWERWWAALPVVAVGVVWWLIAGNSFTLSAVGSLLETFLTNLVVFALAYEFFFRGLLLSRLTVTFRNSLDALAVVALIFGLTQIPAFIAAHGYDLTLVAAKLFVSGGALANLVWGYIFLRTRSVAPGTVCHASPWTSFPF